MRHETTQLLEQLHTYTDDQMVLSSFTLVQSIVCARLPLNRIVWIIA